MTENETQVLKPSEAELAIADCIRVNQPYMLWVAPGTAKTQISCQVAARMELPTEWRGFSTVIHVPTASPVDKVLPYIEAKVEPGETRRRTRIGLADGIPTEGEGLVLLDEMTSGTPLVQTMWQEFVLERRIGSTVLGPGWRIGATGNRVTDKANVHPMPSPLRRRFVHLVIVPDVDDLVRYFAQQEWGTEEVISFLMIHRDLVSQFNPDSYAWPCPANWEKICRLSNGSRPNPKTEFAVYAGIIGMGAASEFMAHLDLQRRLPPLEQFWMNPDGAPVFAGEPASLWAVTVGLGRIASDSTWPAIVRYIERTPEEMQFFLMKHMIAKLKPALMQTKPFTTWAVGHPAWESR